MYSENKKTNRLIQSKSLYLQQHAYNPVNWFPWGDEAWSEAKKLNKPVLVSIGYSACHWCHVMEKECFEDEQTATLMNQFLINIKVDREERPDVDTVYMDACQIMTGRGGWPLNVICLPNGKPIYAGTYFPIESWQQVLLQIQQLWNTEQQKAIEYGENMLQEMKKMNALAYQSNPISRELFSQIIDDYSKQFDLYHGGMKRSPKFVVPVQYYFLQQAAHVFQRKDIEDFVHFSLLKIANGGIFDSVRGGFCRYSTDAKWFAPHFEKMLYDQAQLISLYSFFYAKSKIEKLKEICLSTLDFCNSELLHSAGGYYAALDADSDGEEGKYYTFTWDELQILSKQELEIAQLIFGISQNGNWENGRNILHTELSPAEISNQTSLSVTEIEFLKHEMIQKLKLKQNEKTRPALDSKIILSWNAMMLKALSNAAQNLNSPAIYESALQLEKFIATQLFHNNSWLRTLNHETPIHAFAEDLACLTEAYIALYEANFESQYLIKAKEIAEYCFEHFWNAHEKVFLFYSHQSESLILNKSDFTDDVIPSANGILGICLLKLGYYFNHSNWIQLSSEIINRTRQHIEKFTPWYTNSALLALAETTGVLQVKICGENARSVAKKLQSSLPIISIVAIAEESSKLEITQDIKPKKELQIFICHNKTCFSPLNKIEDAIELIADYW